MADGINAAAEYANKLVEENLKKYLAGEAAKGDNAISAIIAALQGGQGAAQLGKDGQVVGFDWSKMNLPKGLSESESIAALQAALGSASLQAQQADRTAAANKLENILTTIKSSPELATYKAKAAELLNTETPAKSTYRATATPINAWADAELGRLTQSAAKSGLLGQQVTKEAGRNINMDRSAKLATALLNAEETFRQASMQDLLTKANVAKDLFATSTSPEENLQKYIANLYAGSQYVAPQIDWSV